MMFFIPTFFKQCGGHFVSNIEIQIKKNYNILIGCVLLKKAQANSNCRANLDSLSLELAKRRLPRGFYACIKGADCLHKHGRAEV